MLYNNSTLFEVSIYLVSLAQLAAAHHRREQIAPTVAAFSSLFPDHFQIPRLFQASLAATGQPEPGLNLLMKTRMSPA